MRKLFIAVTVIVLCVVAGVVVIQQYGAWATADLERSIEELGPADDVDSCMAEIDGVWLPWLVAEARDMCSGATGGD